jgi:hypothetical protein
MANGHSAEAIEATTEWSEDARGPDVDPMVDARYSKVPQDRADWNQQELNEKQRQETEWQKADEKEMKESVTAKHEVRMKELTGEKPPSTKRDFLNKLVKDHGLVVEEDIFNKDGKWAIIKLTGVEKIQNNLNIRVTFEHIKIEKDFAVIKATAVGQRDSVQSYGSVVKGKHPDGNHAGTYIVEMAEKRAKNRAVLKLCGAYKYGVYSEDESDDFRQDA